MITSSIYKSKQIYLCNPVNVAILYSVSCVHYCESTSVEMVQRSQYKFTQKDANINISRDTPSFPQMFLSVTWC